MVSMRMDVVGVGEAGFGVAAIAEWPTEMIATPARPARTMPATATLCLFMGTGTRFACKIRLLPSVSEVPPVCDAVRLSLQEPDGWTDEFGLS
jgi:hypothetical protein